MLMLKECFLPIAVKTQAVIIVHNTTCSLARAMSELCRTEQTRAGGKLPFTVINFAMGMWVSLTLVPSLSCTQPRSPL